MRIALVTGGTSGIGRGIVERFLVDGYFVECIGYGSEHIEECRQEIASENVRYYQGDVASEDFVNEVVGQISAEHGKLDVLVNSAGVYLGSGGIDETLDRWKQMLDVNLLGTYLVTQKSCPLLKKGDNSSIINISSVCSMFPYSSCSSTSYSVSKAGLDMLTKRLAKELASDGIRVNSINPGVVTSNIWQRSGTSEDDHLKWKKKMEAEMHPLGRTGEPEDVAGLAAFLASPQAEWMTGSIIPLDGGYSVT